MNKNSKKPILTITNISLQLDARIQSAEAKLRMAKNGHQSTEQVMYLQGWVDGMREWQQSIQTEFKYDPTVQP